MDLNINYTKVTFSKFILLLLAISVVAVASSPASAQEEFLPPNHGFSVNYYDSYGEPDIYASLLGDTEFEKGETGEIRIALANKGVPYGFKSVKTVGTSKSKLLSSQKELEYEARRTTASGIKTNLVSLSDYIEVDPETNCQTLDKLVSGEVTDKDLVFTITVSDNAPAGDYLLELPISYEYQSSVEMTNGDLIRLGINDMDHVAYYKNVNETLTIPVHVEESARFEVIETSGNITSGETGIINITYKNIGEITAEDAVARIIAMRPLSSTQSSVQVGTIEPGESKTVSFDVSADPDAIEKNYGIDSEIKYLDGDGDIEFSENLKLSIPLETKEKKIQTSTVVLIGITIIGIYLIANFMRKRGKL